MVWVVFALMTGFAVLCVILPLGRARNSIARRSTDIAFYKTQLAQIERDAARGLVAPGEIDATRTEVARRLLHADETAAAPEVLGRTSRLWRTAAAVFCLVAIPAVTLGLYLKLGSPDQPDQPLEARLTPPPGGHMDLLVAVARIESHLLQHPEDAKGYEILAPVYLRMGRVNDAVNAYRQALQLGDTPDRQENYGEALVAASNGSVTPDALSAFQAALKTDPGRPKSRFYLGLAAAQAGDKDGAVAIFSKLLADDPTASWAASVRARIDSLKGNDAIAQAPASPQGAAIAAMAPEQQRQAIRGMVDQLAEKLSHDGKDGEGWLRLVRAYVVLNEGEKAKTALADARKSLPDDAAFQARLDDLASELGLKG